MHEYWEKVKSEAFGKMHKLLDGYMKVEDTLESMHDALAYTMKHGNGCEKADAIEYFGDYKWAIHEEEAHKAERYVSAMKASQTPSKA
jgi:hypothetical protein